MQCCLRRGGPLYVGGASILTGSVVVVYFVFVFPQVVCHARIMTAGHTDVFEVIWINRWPCLQVLSANNKFVTGCHLSGGVFCLLNIAFNYVGCVLTDPGSTQILDLPVSLSGS